MENITLHQAQAADIDMMIDMRMWFGEELSGVPDKDIVVPTRESLRDYFNDELNKTCLCWYVAADGKPVSIACVILRRQPGGVRNPSGRWGYFMNVYTLPEYRRRGLSAMVINKLIEEARAKGATAFELHATKDGAPVYEKCGFVVHGEPTYRKFV